MSEKPTTLDVPRFVRPIAQTYPANENRAGGLAYTPIGTLPYFGGMLAGSAKPSTVSRQRLAYLVVSGWEPVERGDATGHEPDGRGSNASPVGESVSEDEPRVVHVLRERVVESGVDGRRVGDAVSSDPSGPPAKTPREQRTDRVRPRLLHRQRHVVERETTRTLRELVERRTAARTVGRTASVVRDSGRTPPTARTVARAPQTAFGRSGSSEMRGSTASLEPFPVGRADANPLERSRVQRYGPVGSDGERGPYRAEAPAAELHDREPFVFAGVSEAASGGRPARAVESVERPGPHASVSNAAAVSDPPPDTAFGLRGEANRAVNERRTNATRPTMRLKTRTREADEDDGRHVNDRPGGRRTPTRPRPAADHRERTPREDEGSLSVEKLLERPAAVDRLVDRLYDEFETKRRHERERRGL
ncbi:hypothetical protein [Halogeometricum limi]|nr:hypothetical protein [Halogeometricum limi]